MELLQFRLIDIYLLITLLAVLMVLFALAAFPNTRRSENHLLATIIGLFTGHLLLIALHHEGWISDLIALRTGYAINLTYGPFFYAYFKKAITQKPINKSPVLVWATAGIFLPFLALGQNFYITIMMISLFYNLGLSFRLALKTRHDVKLTGWNKFSLAFFSLLVATYAYEMLIGPATPEAAWQIRFAYFSELLLLSGGFLFFSFRSPAQFLHIRVLNAQKSKGATDPTIHTEINLIIKEIESRQLYRDPGLNRLMLTELTGISPNRISELINGHFGVNFSEWVNTYRINEAQQLLRSEEDALTVKEIYYQVGFNSKSAFYGAFKKATGLTPSLFRQNHSQVSVAPVTQR